MRKPATRPSNPTSNSPPKPHNWRSVAAAFAAGVSDPERGWRLAVMFIVAHAAAWTVILTQLKAAQDIHMDVAEAFAWGQKFQWGYGKHPPLSGWVAGLWFKLFPVVDWATYALAMTVLGVGMFLCWRIARQVVDRRRAFLVLVMLALYPIFNFKGYKYNPDLLQLITLPLVVLAYLNAFEKRSVPSGIWLGLAGAAALMTKYWVLTMIGAVGLAALIHPDRMKLLRSPAPWVALAVMAAAMIPHLIWLKQVDFVPLTYAGDVYGSPQRALNVKLVGLYVAHNIGLLVPVALLAGAALAWRRGWWRGETSFSQRIIALVKGPWARGPNSGVNLPQAINVWWIQIIVGVVPPIAALVLDIYMKTDWGISLFFLTPLALVAIPTLRVRRRALVLLTLLWAVITVVMLAIAPTIAKQTVRTDADVGFGPRSEFAARLTQAWHQRFPTRWAVVAGTTEVGEQMTFYSPDHPAPLTPGEVWSSGLTSLEEAKRLGFIGICDRADPARLPACESWMAENAKGAEQIEMAQRRYFRGVAGAEITWKIFIVPPAR